MGALEKNIKENIARCEREGKDKERMRWLERKWALELELNRASGSIREDSTGCANGL